MMDIDDILEINLLEEDDFQLLLESHTQISKDESVPASHVLGYGEFILIYDY